MKDSPPQVYIRVMSSTAVTEHPGSAIKEMKLSSILFSNHTTILAVFRIHFSCFDLLLFTIMLFWKSLNTRLVNIHYVFSRFR